MAKRVVKNKSSGAKPLVYLKTSYKNRKNDNMVLETKLRDWFEANYKANVMFLEFLEENSICSQKLNSILGHTVLAHKIWLNRLSNQEQKISPWELIDFTETKKTNSENLARTLRLLEEGQLEDHITYKNSKDMEFYNSKIEILFHVLTHSSYHRGQLAMLIRAEGFDPPYTDYISFKR